MVFFLGGGGEGGRVEGVGMGLGGVFQILYLPPTDPVTRLGSRGAAPMNAARVDCILGGCVPVPAYLLPTDPVTRLDSRARCRHR